jgi:Sulfate permease family
VSASGKSRFSESLDPAIAWLRAYDRAWLRGGLVAGLTNAAVVVPQAMAYADIARLPLAVGLYTALVPLVVYAVMGTSRPLSVTTTSMIAILTVGITPSSLAGLNRMGIELVGEVRGGLPSFALPDTSVLSHLLPAASGIALMSRQQRQERRSGTPTNLGRKRTGNSSHWV